MSGITGLAHRAALAARDPAAALIHPALRAVQDAREALPAGDTIPREQVLGLISRVERALCATLAAGGAR